LGHFRIAAMMRGRDVNPFDLGSLVGGSSLPAGISLKDVAGPMFLGFSFQFFGEHSGASMVPQ
jgi:hypothetical protein